MLTIDLARAGVAPNRRVLDLGCGAGRHAFACARLGARVVALDRDARELGTVAGLLAAMADAGEIPVAGAAAVLRGDAGGLPFSDASFDVVIAAEILEHVRDDARMLGELTRVVRPGGVVAISVPRTWPEVVNWGLSRRYHEVEGGHVRIYRRAQLWERLERAGLEVIGHHHAHALHSPYWWLRCLVGVEREANRLVAAYHALLVYDIVHRPRALRALEQLLNPLCGKSLVLYCRRPGSRPALPAGGTRARGRVTRVALDASVAW